MSDIALNISQFRILLRILRYMLGAKCSEPEYKVKELCEETILPEFGEHNYIHEKVPILN